MGLAKEGEDRASSCLGLDWHMYQPGGMGRSVMRAASPTSVLQGPWRSLWQAPSTNQVLRAKGTGSADTGASQVTSQWSSMGEAYNMVSKGPGDMRSGL